MSRAIFKNEHRLIKEASDSELLINGRYTQKLLHLIALAKTSIDVIMYEWRWYKNDTTSDISLINQALLQALRRGVKVRAIVNNAGQMQQLKAIGFDIRTNDKGTLMHSKALIFDKSSLLMGSHNLTNNAMRSNIESSVFIKNEILAQQFSAYFESIWQS